VVDGESHLDDNAQVRSIGIADVALSSRVRVNPAARDAIADANVVVIGPGDHFGSIIPNLLVRGVSRAIKQTSASVVFVAPLTNKRGHTEGFAVEDYIRELERYIGRGRIDYVIYNTQSVPPRILARYEEQEGKNSLVRIRDMQADRTFRIVQGDLLNTQTVRVSARDRIAATRSFIRHDPDALARAVALIAYQGEHGMEII